MGEWMFSVAAYDRQLGELLRRREITSTEFAILNRMVWTLRSRTSDRTQATIDLIAARTGASRQKVIDTISRAIGLGILRKVKTRVRRAIGAVVRFVNGANIYIFVAQSTQAPASLKASLNPSLTSEYVPAKGCIERERWHRAAPHPPIRSVAEQLRALGMGI